MNEQESEAVPGFEIPLHVSLTQPIFQPVHEKVFPADDFSGVASFGGGAA